MRKDCEVRAIQITAHIVEARVRERTKNNIASFLADLEEIRSFDDPDTNDSTARIDDSDGVTPISAEQFHMRESDRIGKIGNLFAGTALEPETEIIEEANTESDIDAIIPGHWGYTKLIAAAADGNTDLVRSLLEQKANPDIRDTSGMTALDKALNGGYDEVVVLLMPVTSDI